MNPLISRHKSARGHFLGGLVSALAVASALVIVALHDHDCAGDGCLLCLVVGWCHAILCLCVSITVARAILYALMHLRVLPLLPHEMLCPTRPTLRETRLPRVSLTPVTMGVQLLI